MQTRTNLPAFPSHHRPLPSDSQPLPSLSFTARPLIHGPSPPIHSYTELYRAVQLRVHGAHHGATASGAAAEAGPRVNKKGGRSAAAAAAGGAAGGRRHREEAVRPERGEARRPRSPAWHATTSLTAAYRASGAEMGVGMGAEPGAGGGAEMGVVEVSSSLRCPSPLLLPWPPSLPSLGQLCPAPSLP